MKILVVAATQPEIQPFIEQTNGVEILISGVGIPSTVYHLTAILMHERYDLVIQAGIAGSFSKKIKNEEVVAVERDAFADIGAEENKRFKTIFQLGLGNENEFPFRNGWLLNSSEILSALPLKKVTAITINKITDRKKQIKYLKKIFNAEIESMEGAAFQFVCLQQNIPFLQLRGISNKAGERDKGKWNINEAIKNLNAELIKLVDSINK
jgi:futalosine hydrolase